MKLFNIQKEIIDSVAEEVLQDHAWEISNDKLQTEVCYWLERSYYFNFEELEASKEYLAKNWDQEKGGK